MLDYTLNKKTKDALIGSGTATIANVLLKHGLSNVYLLGISPLDRNQKPIVGPAYTLRFIPSREDIDTMKAYSSDRNIHRRAIEECPAGSVLVIDAMSSTLASSAGDMMAARLKVRGVEGIITDGGFRDSPGIIDSGLSAYHRRPAPPATPIALHPVDLNVPIGCAGVPVYPGDIIVADSEGVVVIPKHLVDEVAATAKANAEYEEYVQLRIQQGASIFGLFPATEQSLVEYKAWREAGKPSDKKE